MENMREMQHKKKKKKWKKKFLIHFWYIFFFSGVPRVLQTRVSLPLALVCVPSSPAKTTKFKITVDTNQPPVDLNEIFPGKTHTYRTLTHTDAVLSFPNNQGSAFESYIFYKSNILFCLRLWQWRHLCEVGNIFVIQEWSISLLLVLASKLMKVDLQVSSDWRA